MHDERARIYDEYDKRNKRGVYAPCDDVDSDDYFRTPEEKRAALNAQMGADLKEGNIARARSARERIYDAKRSPAPEVAPDDGRPAVARAVDSFLDANPRFTKETEWNTLYKTAMESTHDDVFRLRKKFDETDDPAACRAWLERSAEVMESEQVEASRRAAFRQMAEARSPIR